MISKANIQNQTLKNSSGNWLLEQGGNFYFKSVFLPYIPGVYTPVSISGTVAADWNQINSVTGAVNTSSHPDFSASGGAIEFGVVGATSFSPGPAATIDVRFDNVSIDLHTVPEPAVATSIVGTIIVIVIWLLSKSYFTNRLCQFA